MDIILGGPGDDQLQGNEGNDALVGGAGNDQIQGGDGRDVLIGRTESRRTRWW